MWLSLKGIPTPSSHMADMTKAAPSPCGFHGHSCSYLLSILQRVLPAAVKTCSFGTHRLDPRPSLEWRPATARRFHESGNPAARGPGEHFPIDQTPAKVETDLAELPLGDRKEIFNQKIQAAAMFGASSSKSGDGLLSSAPS